MSVVRAFKFTEELLTDGAWKRVGPGFTDVNVFLASVQLSKDMKPALDARKNLAARIRELQPEASNRAIAKHLGVGRSSIDRDRGSNGPDNGKKDKSNQGRVGSNGPRQSGEQAGKASVRASPEERQQAALERTRQVEFDAKALGLFPVIYADPPWRYENPPVGSSSRSIENKYPTMDLAEICVLPVREIIHENAVLFLWATAPKLAECMAVITAWGFNYRTNMVWVKDKIGMGYHVRNQHELLLIAKKGELPPPTEENRPSSVLFAERLEHSAKPAALYEMIDAMYPNLRKVELFSRNQQPRQNWSYWGNQS
jgi:N6-adenosine-specific RNA methylase IME4